MSTDFTLGRTATGRLDLIIARNVEYELFETHAQRFVDRFDLSISKTINGPGTLMWLVTLADHDLCISWDDWCYNVTVMSWGDTPDDVIRDIYNRG